MSRHACRIIRTQFPMGEVPFPTWVVYEVPIAGSQGRLMCSSGCYRAFDTISIAQ